ncbi:MAG: hypothetical protein U5K32_05280 [Bacteroidales bacterium]|nr:hypothetical protein [Bacteroidales bacterium]
MKKLIYFFILAVFACFPGITKAQVPETINYQAVARDGSGNLITDQEINVRISLHTNISSPVNIYIEEHQVTTNSYGMFSLQIGDNNASYIGGSVTDFSDIDWNQEIYIKPSVKLSGGDWQDMESSPLSSVPYALVAGELQNKQLQENADTLYKLDGSLSIGSGKPDKSMLAVVSRDDASEDALFEVRRKDGQPVFSVYNNGVQIHVDDAAAKGPKGGFAIGGFDRAKGVYQDYLLVSPDSIRLFIENNPDLVKGTGSKGGFAIGGFDQSKQEESLYFNISGKADADTVSSSAQFLWYPLKEAFLAGRVHIGSPDSVGLNSTALGYHSVAKGNYSQAFGYESMALAANTTAIGYGATASGIDSYAFGRNAQAKGEKSISIGSHYTHSYSYIPIFSLTKSGDTKGDFLIRPILLQPIWRTVTYDRANIAEGKYSISLGNGNYANNGGFAVGIYNDATAYGATAIGLSNKSLSTSSFTAGFESKAGGPYATAIGNNLYAKSYGSFVIGQFNTVAGDSLKWRATDPLFVVGNGLNNSNRSNALTINKDGKSIFMGQHANISLNDKRLMFIYNPVTGIFSSSTNVYGVKSYINRADADVNYYYSGYFYDTGSEGNYNGLYADVRTGNNADIAEYILNSKQDAEPGDVVIADKAVDKNVMLSNKPYDPTVIGVVSTEPHITMGMELVTDEKTGKPLSGVSAVRLALAGRVPCKVTDENGPIEPGDFLTASSTPGHAMKWTYADPSDAADFDELKEIMAENEKRRNSILGKAMETHEYGSGKIMIIIALQ